MGLISSNMLRRVARRLFEAGFTPEDLSQRREVTEEDLVEALTNPPPLVKKKPEDEHETR